MLDCGHPEECEVEEYNEHYCGWCSEVNSLKRTIDALERSFEFSEKAVIINDGSPTVEGPIGYLKLLSGTVNIKSPAGGYFTSPPANTP
jgi:hypothetical protein